MRIPEMNFCCALIWSINNCESAFKTTCIYKQTSLYSWKQSASCFDSLCGLSKQSTMRHQQVSVNVWQMVQTSCTYLALAFCAWLLLRLINACFWLPGYLSKQREDEMKKERDAKQKLLEEKQTVQVSGEELEVASAQAVSEESKKTI